MLAISSSFSEYLVVNCGERSPGSGRLYFATVSQSSFTLGKVVNEKDKQRHKKRATFMLLL